MAQETRNGRPYETPYESDYASYEDRYAEPVDLDFFGSQLRSHHPARSVATREEFLPEEFRSTVFVWRGRRASIVEIRSPTETRVAPVEDCGLCGCGVGRHLRGRQKSLHRLCQRDSVADRGLLGQPVIVTACDAAPPDRGSRRCGQRAGGNRSDSGSGLAPGPIAIAR